MHPTRQTPAVRTRLDTRGRFVIPAAWRRILDVGAGDPVVLALAEDGLHVRTTAQAVARAQTIVGRHVRRARLLSRELLDERAAGTARGPDAT